MSGGDNSVHTESKIGRALELARKERDLSLKQVEEATKIRAAYLAELERENFGVLPAVYVQGSLKTYANFLQLDGEEMVRELKRQQAPREEPSYPLYVGPREDDSLDDILVAIGGAGGVEPQDEVEDEAKDEADARPALLLRGIAGYLYLGSAVAVVVVVAAAALALTVVGDGRPVVSQVREPLISQEPKTSPPNITQEDARTQQPSQGDEQRADDEGGKDEEADRRSQAEQAQGDSSQTQVSASATASASAAAEATPATLEPGAASSLEATEEPDERSPIGVGASDSTPQSGTAPASSSPVAAQPTRRPPAAPSGGSRNPPAQDAGGLEVRVRIGAEDPVRLSGGPFDD
jgi:transcriptional regulator with XRE-family HTH domain